MLVAMIEWSLDYICALQLTGRERGCGEIYV